jgi:hypothetical protein
MALELSQRAQQMLNARDFLSHYAVLCMDDPFDCDTNKEVKFPIQTLISGTF